MAGNPDDWPVVIDSHAFDAHLPATLPVTVDGSPIEGATAEVTQDVKGLSVSMTIPHPDA